MKPLLFAFVILTAVGQHTVAQSLNVMTWNIRYNNTGDGINAWPNRKDWVAENTHFDHRGTQARVESATLLLKHLREEFVDHPVILTGDLNTMPDSPPYNTLTGKGTETRPVYLDAYEHSVQKRKGPDSTWNGFNAIVPKHRIDFVFTTKSVRVNRFQTLDDQRESRFPSDHLPVVTELELMKE